MLYILPHFKGCCYNPSIFIALLFLPLVTLSSDSQPLIYLNGSPEVSSGIGFHLTLLTTHLLLNVDFTQLLKFA